MPAEPATARIVHRVPGRVRLVVPSQQGVRGYFDEVALALASVRGVQRVRTRPRAASVVIWHTATEGALLEEARAAGLFAIAPDEPDRRDPAATEGRPTSPRADLDLLLVIGLACAGFFQLFRGQVLPPALTLFSYALAIQRADLWGGAAASDASEGNGNGDS